MLNRWLILFVALLGASLTAQGQETTPPSAPAQTQPQAEPEPSTPQAAEQAADRNADLAVERDGDDERASDRDARGFKWRTREDDVVLHIGEDARLAADDEANGVVSVFGSAIAEGEVRDAVVSVFGDARSTGRVGEAVVAVMGNVYVDGYVGDEVVAVLGSVTLGPNAEVDGEVKSIGGDVTRDPGAIVHGATQEIAIGEDFIAVEGIRQWIRHCLLLARPLAFEPGLGWAWGLAFGFLAFYVLLALLFGDAMNKCVDTLETRPGESVLAALLSVVLTPVAFFVLLISIIGMLLIPFLGLALFAGTLFGKAVAFGWLGRRITRLTGIGAFSQIAFAVLVGGLVMMLIYVVPVIGFIAYKVVGLIGFGVVLMTLVLAVRARRAAAAPAYSPALASTGAVITDPAVAGAATTLPPQTVADLAAPRAGFWVRMGALLIDLIIVAVGAAMLADDGAVIILLAAYGALMWKLKGTTLGGMVCNLQIVRVDGRPIEWDTAVVRALSCFVSAIPAGLGFIWIAFDPDRQAWHDKIAGTIVVRVPRVAQSPAPAAPTV